MGEKADGFQPIFQHIAQVNDMNIRTKLALFLCSSVHTLSGAHDQHQAHTFQYASYGICLSINEYVHANAKKKGHTNAHHCQCTPEE